MKIFTIPPILSSIGLIFGINLSIVLSIVLAACTTTAQWQTQEYSDVIFNTLAAEFALRENDPEESSKYYIKALEKSSDAAFIASAIEFFFSYGNYIDAIRGSEILLKLKPQDETLKKLLPYLYLSTAQADKAIAMLDSFDDRQLTTDVFVKISKVGFLNIDEKKLAGLQKAAKHFSDNAMAQYAYAVSADYFKDYDQAIIFADRGLALAPYVDIGYKVKADALQKSGRPDKSVAVLHAGVGKLPENISLRMSYAQALHGTGKNEEAYRQLMNLYRTMPEASSNVVQLLGTIALELGKNEEALEHFKELENFPGMNLRARYFQAYALFQWKNFISAMHLLQNIPPASGAVFEQANLLIARIYQDQMMIDQAVSHLSEAMAQVEDSERKINFYIAQARILSAAGYYTQAREIYSLAITEFPEHLTFYLLRAFNGIKMNDLETIEKDVHHILSKDVNHVDALNLLGYHLADMNIRLDEAKEYLVRAYKINSEDPRIIDSLGWIEFRLKNFESAERLIRRAIEKYPDPEIYGHLVEILRARNQFLEAENQLNEALQIYPDDKYLKNL